MQELHRPFLVKVIAGCFALAAFAIAIVSGLAVDRTATSILGTAIAALFICQFIGLIMGMAVECALRERVAAYRMEHPVVPEHSAPVADTSAQAAEPEHVDT